MAAVLALARKCLSPVVAFALPPRCPGCGAITPVDHSFCGDCWGQLDFLDAQACVTCAEPFELDSGAGARCGACLADPPAIDGLRAAVAYGDIARRIVLKLKHGRRPGVARTIAVHMDRLLAETRDPLLVPVPLHRWRIWSRGYNQSALIANALAHRRKLETALDAIIRHRATPMLRNMGPAQRRRAVRGAFSLSPAGKAQVKGRAVVLVDDIYTTGATINACARVLKRAGALEVRAICWARVVLDHTPDGGGGR